MCASISQCHFWPVIIWIITASHGATWDMLNVHPDSQTVNNCLPSTHLSGPMQSSHLSVPPPSSHINSGPASAQYARSRQTLEKIRQECMANADHFIYECSVLDWFSTATSLSSQTNKKQRFHLNHASEIRDKMRKDHRNILGKSGFTSLQSFLDNRENLSEDAIYKTLEDVSRTVVDLAKQLYPEFYNDKSLIAAFRCTGTRPAHSDVPGPNLKPDGRNILETLPDSISQNIRRSPRSHNSSPSEGLSSVIAADTSCIYEFKKDENPRWIQDVRCSMYP